MRLGTCTRRSVHPAEPVPLQVVSFPVGMRAYTSPMRKATILPIALAVGIGIVTDRALLTLHERQSHRVETESSHTFEMEIDGQKRVVVLLTDSADSIRAAK